jgi:hypothetical protein
MNLLMGKLSRFKHLSDETISRLICGELATIHAFGARSHIERCWHCRSRREALERAAMQVTEHRNRLSESVPINPDGRARLIADLRSRGARNAPQQHRANYIFHIRTWVGNRMSSLLASAVIITAAAALLLMVWQRSASPILPAQLLQRAAATDAVVSSGNPGVVYQKVRITTAHLAIEHEIYRDPRGVRTRRAEQAKGDSVAIRETLAKAGVDWDRPLASSSFQGWHDRQTVITDEVRAEEGNLITIVSRVPSGWITAESLTVRASDFHPVARRIETRSSEPIEIAEVSYAVLPWDGVNEALFEPLGRPVHDSAVLVPSPPTPTDLDSAELAARVTLNDLHADQGEQISITRTDRAVEVKGVVETDERRRELVRSLGLLPRVKTDILSLAELQALPTQRDRSQTVQVQSVDVSPSPLATYLATSPNKQGKVGEASQGLLDAALSVRQNASELLVLKERFSIAGESTSNRKALTKLTENYSQRLRAALDAETSALSGLEFQDRSASSPISNDVDLRAAIDRNNTLCSELIAGGNGTRRPAPEIAEELYESIARIKAAVEAFPESTL